jgi:N,N'-diacetylbacillosaminyl-diphospho-undecaprenol alpha-1,3-N-acetylgalactosaminyltransferase
MKKPKKNNFKKNNRINKNKKVVLFFGRLNITKSPDNFVKIAKIILKKRQKDDVVFVIRGPDEGMRKIVKKLIGNEKRILLMNETRDKKEIANTYYSADIYVLPSFREGLPLTLFEAMAAGLTIVATPVNGVSFEIKQGENGFLIKHGDNEKFADKICELLDNEKLRKEISGNNKSKAKNFSWDAIHKRTIEVYTAAISNKAQ